MSRDTSAAPAPAAGAQATSIWEVARVAGVSHQTVSRVINGKPHVKDSTRALVLRTIEELGFTPNRSAQALAGGRARSVTVLTVDPALYGYAAALRGIEEEARAAGFTVGISVLEPDAATSTQDVMERLGRPGAPAVVIAFETVGARVLDALPADHPVVGLMERPDSGQQQSGRPQVWIDDRGAAAHATRYLLSLGHRTVHHLSIPSSTTRLTQRTHGWQDALRSAGRPVPTLLDAGWTPRSGYLAASTLLADPGVTAILCGNDDVALGVLRAAHEAGRDVPGDLSVIGFDDAPQSAYLTPSLTTVRLDFEGLGRSAFGLLHALLDPDSAPAPGLWAEPELIVRESSGPAPR
jgi:DNA-binding LacI/PurR family transcriptional regulator